MQHRRRERELVGEPLRDRVDATEGDFDRGDFTGGDFGGGSGGGLSEGALSEGERDERARRAFEAVSAAGLLAPMAERAAGIEAEGDSAFERRGEALRVLGPRDPA